MVTLRVLRVYAFGALPPPVRAGPGNAHLGIKHRSRVAGREVRAELQSRGTPQRSSELVGHLSRAEMQVRLEAEAKQDQEAGRNNSGDETAAARARHESVWRADVHRYDSGEF